MLQHQQELLLLFRRCAINNNTFRLLLNNYCSTLYSSYRVFSIIFVMSVTVAASNLPATTWYARTDFNFSTFSVSIMCLLSQLEV
jgi:hypothetical protein